jgi:hypothetical protein
MSIRKYVTLQIDNLNETEEENRSVSFHQRNFDLQSLHKIIAHCENKWRCNSVTFHLNVTSATVILTDTLSETLIDLTNNFTEENAATNGFEKNVDIANGVIQLYIRPAKGSKKRDAVSSALDSEDGGSRKRAPKSELQHFTNAKTSTIKTLIPRDSDGFYASNWNQNDPTFWGWGLIECIGRIHAYYKEHHIEHTIPEVKQMIREYVYLQITIHTMISDFLFLFVQSYCLNHNGTIRRGKLKDDIQEKAMDVEIKPMWTQYGKYINENRRPKSFEYQPVSKF